jgi:enterochelin esterase-like enzyme
MTGTWTRPTGVVKSAGTWDGTSRLLRTTGDRTWRWCGPDGDGRCLGWCPRRGSVVHRELVEKVPSGFGDKPACVMVFQDGIVYVSETGDFRVPVVFDNLIHKQEMPVTIGIFLNPGHEGEPPPEKPFAGSNRSFEYNTLSDQYARFLLEEILPEIGKRYKLTDDPDRRAICGISSGGICAFTVAWQRPDAFRKVLSHVGSFTNIRGGHVYPSLIRSTPNKPIRVFLQDGENDLDNVWGNWWLANLQMEAALKFKQYDYKFVGGTGGHSGKHGGAILPDSLRWLWRDTEPTANGE